MKKIFRVFIVFMLIMSVFISTAYASTQHDIDELDMSVCIPEDFMVFTRNTSTNDPNLSIIGMNKESLEQQFTQGNIYLDAIKNDYSTQIIVTMTQNSGATDIFDLNLYTEEEKRNIAEEEQKSDALKTANAKYTGYAFCKNKQASFICFNISSSADENNLYSKQYFTIINGQAINIILYSSNGLVSADQENILKSVIDNISFSKVKQKPIGLFANISGWVIAGAISASIFGVFMLVVGITKKKRRAIRMQKEL